MHIHTNVCVSNKAAKVKETELKRAMKVGTKKSDIGTKPLSQQRRKLLLHKCHAIDGDGNRVGEKERQEVEERQREREREREMQRGKIQRLAKALEKIMYASGP